MAALVASVEEEEVGCIVAAAAVEEALMVGLYSYPVVACLEALADSSEALEEAFAVEEALVEAFVVAGEAFYSFLLDLAALAAVDLDSY